MGFRLATISQRRKLERLGVFLSIGISQERANEIIEELSKLGLCMSEQKSEGRRDNLEKARKRRREIYEERMRREKEDG